MGDIVELFGGPVARLYRRSLVDQGFEVLMMTVFDIADRQGYAVGRSIDRERRNPTSEKARSRRIASSLCRLEDGRR